MPTLVETFHLLNLKRSQRIEIRLLIYLALNIEPNLIAVRGFAVDHVDRLAGRSFDLIVAIGFCTERTTFAHRH